MIRLYLAVGLLLATIAAVLAVYFMGGQAATDRAKVDQLEGTVENAETFNKGASNADGNPWFRRLFPDATE